MSATRWAKTAAAVAPESPAAPAFAAALFRPRLRRGDPSAAPSGGAAQAAVPLPAECEPAASPAAPAGGAAPVGPSRPALGALLAAAPGCRGGAARAARAPASGGGAAAPLAPSVEASAAAAASTAGGLAQRRAFSSFFSCRAASPKKVPSKADMATHGWSFRTCLARPRYVDRAATHSGKKHWYGGALVASKGGRGASPAIERGSKLGATRADIATERRSAPKTRHVLFDLVPRAAEGRGGPEERTRPENPSAWCPAREAVGRVV